MTTHHALRLTPALFLTLAAPCSGAGFQLAERSASGLGRAFSGEAAIADDASVIASNPAGMILLGGDWSYSAGMTGIFPNLDVQGAFGAGGPPIPTAANDVAYTHIFSDDMRVVDGSPATGIFNGTASGEVDLLSIGVSGEF